MHILEGTLACKRLVTQDCAPAACLTAEPTHVVDSRAFACPVTFLSRHCPAPLHPLVPAMQPVSHLLVATTALGLALATFVPRQVQQPFGAEQQAYLPASQLPTFASSGIPPLLAHVAAKKETYEGASVIRVQAEHADRMPELMAIAAVRPARPQLLSRRISRVAPPVATQAKADNTILRCAFATPLCLSDACCSLWPRLLPTPLAQVV